MRNIRLNHGGNIRPWRMALSDRDGTARLYHYSDPGCNSFGESNPVQSGEDVATVTLDGFLATQEVTRVDVIKIDVEGAEEQVLRGAVATLQRHRPLVAFEHGAGSADRYGSGPDAIHGLLTDELGYEILGLDGDGPYGRGEFAAIFASGEQVNFVASPGGAASR
jgi:FkbM family methyltransferase